MKDYVDCIAVRKQWQEESAVPDIIGRQYEKTAINTSKPVRSVRNLEASTIYRHKNCKELLLLGHLLNGEWISLAHSL